MYCAEIVSFSLVSGAAVASFKEAAMKSNVALQEFPGFIRRGLSVAQDECGGRGDN